MNFQFTLDNFFIIRSDDMPNQEPSRDKRLVPPNKPPVPRFHHFQLRSDPDTYHEAILRCLYPIRSLTVKEMAVECGMSVKMVSYKLKELRKEGLVEKDAPRVCEVSGKRVRCYRLI